uniref:Uncharacterized protein n=1 Tax=Oryza glumipatula TaxID=40148 RepID=A0A0E0BHW4_9ORYZ
MAGGGGKSVVAALAVAFFLLAAFASGLSTGDATSGRGTSGGGGSGAARLRQAAPTLAPRPLVGDATSGRCTCGRGGNGAARLWQAPSGAAVRWGRRRLLPSHGHEGGGCGDGALRPNRQQRGARAARGWRTSRATRGKALGENLHGEEERVRGRGGITRRVARAGAVEDVERRERSTDEEAKHSG